MKKLGGVLLAIAAGAGVLYGTFYGATKYLDGYAQAGKPGVASCTQKGATHTVTIHKGMVSPGHTYGRVCDVLLIVNEDNRLRFIAFGAHDHHVAYDGVTEQALKRGERLAVVLNQAGTYHFHDHEQDSVTGEFTVR